MQRRNDDEQVDDQEIENLAPVVSFPPVRKEAATQGYACDPQDKNIPDTDIYFIKMSIRVYEVIYRKKNKRHGYAYEGGNTIGVQSPVN